MARQSQMGHLLSSNGLADSATEVRLRAQATKAVVPVSRSGAGIALVDAALKVERDPARGRATDLAKAKCATARGKAAKKTPP